MRQLTGLTHFFDKYTGTIKAGQVIEFMQEQFAGSDLIVYAEPLSEQKTILAKLSFAAEMVNYDSYAQRLEFVFIGTVIDEQIPLTYIISGLNLTFFGRCSVLPKVCGVDLYFSNYKRSKNFCVRQKITISIKDLVKELKKSQKAL